MNKSYSFKLTIQRLKIFGVLAIVIVLAAVSCYFKILSATEERIINSVKTDIQNEFAVMEKEINMQKSVLQNITVMDSYYYLSNPAFYGIYLDSVDGLSSKENIRNSFAFLKYAVTHQNYAYMMFRNSDLLIDVYGATSSFKSAYENSWKLAVNGEDFNIDAATAQIFGKKHNNIEGSYSYIDINSGKEREIVYMMTLSSLDGETADAVFMACYDADEMIGRMGVMKYADSVLVTAGDSTVYTRGTERKPSEYDARYYCTSLDMTVYYTISRDYINRNMRPVNMFLVLFILIFAAAGLGATAGISYVDNRHIRKIISMAEKTSGINYTGETDCYEYMEYVYKNLENEAQNAKDELRKMLYVKLLSFELAEDEQTLLLESMTVPCMIVMLKNYAVKHRSWTQPLAAYIKKNGIDVFQTLKINETEMILFLCNENNVEESIRDLAVYLNREYRTDMRGVICVISSLSEVKDKYTSMKKAIQYLEYGCVKMLGDIDENTGENEIGELVSKSKQLYEIIRSGNEFEAKRLVYEQWYKISQGLCGTDGIEQLFYSHVSTISQLTSDFKLNLKIPRYDMNKDVVSIAFEITECIEQICAKLRGNGKKNNVKSTQIVEYINQRYSDSSFYMPELVGKFEMSDRAIVQLLKSATGENFSNYVGKLRIKKAEELLTTTGMSVSEVAANSGFDSSNSLYKAFKKVYGVSPSTYRENRDKNME